MMDDDRLKHQILHSWFFFSVKSRTQLSKQPEVLLPSGVDKVTSHSIGLFSNPDCTAICMVDALFHKQLWAAGPTEAAREITMLPG